MSPSFLVNIFCYTWRPFTITLTSSAVLFRQRPTQKIADDVRLLVNDLYV